MSDEKIDFEIEASDCADRGGLLSTATAIAWGESIAARVEEQTIKRCAELALSDSRKFLVLLRRRYAIRRNTPKWGWPYAGRGELLCSHGVGHGGIHGCDGCCDCKEYEEAKAKRTAEGFKLK